MEDLFFNAEASHWITVTYATQGDIISLERQIQNHRNIYNRVVKKLGGSNKAKKYLSKCLYYMKIGTNDYYDNYFFPQVSSTVPDLTTDRYAADLVRRYSSYMKVLYKFLYLFFFFLTNSLGVNFTLPCLNINPN